MLHSYRWVILILCLCGWVSSATSWANVPAKSAASPPKDSGKTAATVPTAKPKATAVETKHPSTGLPEKSGMVPTMVPQDSMLYHILQSRTVRVCVRSDIPPFGYFQKDTLSGFDIALAKELITLLGIRFQTTLQRQWVVIQAAERVESLQKGRCDLVVAAFSKTVEREKLVSFSTVYNRTGKVVLRRVGDVSSAPVVARVKSATGSQLNVPNAVYSSFLGYSDILYTMRQKLVDYVITDYPTGLYLIRNSKAAYQIHETLPQIEEYGVGVAKGHIHLLREINLALQQLNNNGRLAHMRRQWLQ